jgi:hypothetical protein
MALTGYLRALRTLLHDQASQFYSDATLTGFINEARVQVAAEGECIKGVGSFTAVPGQSFYRTSVVTVPTIPQGIAGLVTPNSLSYNPSFAAGGLVTLDKRNWEWFNFYVLGFAAKQTGFPYAWCPFTQGSSTLPQGATSPGGVADGSFYMSPTTMSLPINVDGIWYPINLATDGDPEALTGLFNDAVPIYGQYLAYMDSRLSQLAESALQLYGVFMARARGIVTPLADQQAYPGDLAARQAPGQAPPLRGGDRVGPAGRSGGPQ